MSKQNGPMRDENGRIFGLTCLFRSASLNKERRPGQEWRTGPEPTKGDADREGKGRGGGRKETFFSDLGWKTEGRGRE